MARRVRCDLPNAAGEIGGVRYRRAEDGAMVSEEMDAAQAELLATIPGYSLLPEEKPEEKKEAPPKGPVPGDLDGDGKRDRPARKAAAAPKAAD